MELIALAEASRSRRVRGARPTGQRGPRGSFSRGSRGSLQPRVLSGRAFLQACRRGEPASPTAARSPGCAPSGWCAATSRSVSGWESVRSGTRRHSVSPASGLSPGLACTGSGWGLQHGGRGGGLGAPPASGAPGGSPPTVRTPPCLGLLWKWGLRSERQSPLGPACVSVVSTQAVKAVRCWPRAGQV